VLLESAITESPNATATESPAATGLTGTQSTDSNTELPNRTTTAPPLGRIITSFNKTNIWYVTTVKM